MLRNDSDVSPIESGKRDKIESYAVKDESNENEEIPIKSNFDKSSDKKELETRTGEALAASDNDHLEKSPLKFTPSTTEESWSKNHQVPICSISTDPYNTSLSNAPVLSPSINANPCPVVLMPCIETGESVLSNQQHSRYMVLTSGHQVMNQALQPHCTTIHCTENQIPVQSINAMQPNNTVSNGSFVFMNPVQVYPQNTIMNSSFDIHPQNLHTGVQNGTTFTPKQKITLEASTSAYPLSNPCITNRGNDASPQAVGNATFSQSPILLAMPIMASNPGIFQTGSPMTAQFSKNPAPFLTQGGVAYIPSALNPELSTISMGTSVDKLTEESQPSHNFISYPQLSNIPLGPNLQLIQSIPTHQPTAVNVNIAKLAPQ